MSTTRTYAVRGMTCNHCVLSVTRSISDVTGVERVDVELAGGRLTVTGESFSDGAVSAAVAEAGYEVVA